MIYLYAAGALAIAAASFAGGWQVRAWKAGNDAAAIVEATHRAVQAQAARADSAATTYEGQRAAREVQTRYIDREVVRVVQAPVYAGTCMDADGLRLIAASLAGSAPDTGHPTATVQDSGATK